MDNLSRLRKALTTPAMLVSNIGNVGWLTGFAGTYGVAIVTPDKARFITDGRYVLQAGEEVKGFEIVSFSTPTDEATFLGQQLADLGIKEIGFESSTVTVDQSEKWKTAAPGVNWISASEIIPPLRMIKSADEIEKIRAACVLADKTFDHVRRTFAAGVTELDIELDLEFFMRRHGATVAFPSIVVSGNRSARPHGHASEKQLEYGDLLTLDFGACVDGYNSDITRTVGIGELDERKKGMYNAVLEAQIAALEFIKPGLRAADADKAARDVLAKHDLAQYFTHSLGHGLGRLVHDYGRMSATSNDVFEPGQVWTVEPGVYVEGVGGVRIEDDIVVTERGIEILNRSPKDLLQFPSAN